MEILKTKLPILSIIFILIVGLFWVGVNQVWAADVTYAQNTTWTTDVGNITILANSTATSVVTTSTTMTISMVSGEQMILQSANKRHLSNNGGYNFTCNTTNSELVISATSTQTVVVTPQSTTCSDTGGSSGGGGTTTSGGGGATPATTTPTPTPSVSPLVSTTPTPVPTSVPVATSKPTPVSKGFVSLAAVSLKDGDVISAGGSSDPDVYIVNPHGYKRLFLNPAIFNFYGHLGGFSKIKSTTSNTRDVFVTSGLFRNCETNDPKVYGVETTGEDTGTLHWVNTTGDQAVKDDPSFFKKVFCINTKEFGWYKKGSDYTSVNQVPDYTRSSVSSSSVPVSTTNQYKVVSSVGYLNVRSLASTSGSILGKLNAGDKITSLGQSGVWHKIKFEGKDGWVHGDYLTKI